MGDNIVDIIGGGLAGSEAAYQAAKRGARVRLFEMKPARFSPAHTLETLAELVCSNSMKALSPQTASGLLKEEMRRLDSIIVKAAYSTRVPSGGALAVDRGAFSARVTDELRSMGVEIIRGEVESVPRPPAGGRLIIATGPLTSDSLAGSIRALIGMEGLYFYDAVAPIIYRDSVDMDKAFFSSRYGKGGDDYLNCPLEKEEYERFVAELTRADRAAVHGFDAIPVFEGCMPVEVMAERGVDTLAFGPMKPVGLTDPRTGRRPHAVAQLRSENREGTLYNMVGFQTRLSYPEQQRVFRLIPGLEKAEFARFGKLHRNTYIDSPRVLTAAQQLRSDAAVFFAGQITGVEGYCESSASGLMAGLNAARSLAGFECVTPPPTTIMGALMGHISSSEVRPFQPMNANFGLLPQGASRAGGRAGRREALSNAALLDLDRWLAEKDI